MEDFYRIRRLPPYVFEQVNRAKAAARNAGADIIDLGMGNPDLPAPAHVLEKLKEVVGKPRTDRYSSSRGIPGLRKAQASYYGRRFGVKLNPDTQVVATLGSKEGFANVAHVRQEARDLHPVGSGLRGSLFRRQRPAALGAAGPGRDGRYGRIHLDVEDLFDAGLAHGLCGRQ